METFQTLGDMLLRRYVVDYIAQAQNLAAPIWSRVPENSNFIPSGQGAFFPIRLDGNETGGAWRAIDDNQLPGAGNERTVQAKVTPTKYYHVVSFSGIAEAVSNRGGEDAFASAITDALSTAVTRAGANFEFAFLRSDGSGALTTATTTSASTTLNVADARPFRANMVIEILDATTGVKKAGPITVMSRNIAANTVTVNSAVTAATGDFVHPAGEQSGIGARNSNLTILGLPAIVTTGGTIYGVSRSTFPILDSKIIPASSASLDESMLRRLRKRIMVETAVGTTDNFVVLSNWEQYDRYTEIALPYRRFLDMRLELGASQEMTTFEGRPWLIAYLCDPTAVYMLNMSAIERGTVRPFSLDERVNMQWIPGYDAFTVLFKAYLQTVARMPNQLGAVTGLSAGTY